MKLKEIFKNHQSVQCKSGRLLERFEYEGFDCSFSTDPRNHHMWGGHIHVHKDHEKYNQYHGLYFHGGKIFYGKNSDLVGNKTDHKNCASIGFSCKHEDIAMPSYENIQEHFDLLFKAIEETK